MNLKNYFLVYSTWESYSECSKTCGDGEKTKTRTCIGGICSLASSNDLIQTEICNERDCQSPWARISRHDLQLQDKIVYPNYEFSIDLKLDDNTLSGWSNVLGCSQAHLPTHEPGTYFHGGRVPAVFVRHGHNRLHVCFSIGNDGNSCWDPDEYTVGEEFNLKIKECFQISSS